MQVYLEMHLLPITVPVRVTNDLDTLVTEEILAMNAWLRHGRCTILEEPNNVDPFRSNPHLQDEIDLGMDLMVRITTV